MKKSDTQPFVQLRELCPGNGAIQTQTLASCYLGFFVMPPHLEEGYGLIPSSIKPEEIFY